MKIKLYKSNVDLKKKKKNWQRIYIAVERIYEVINLFFKFKCVYTPEI